MSSNDFRDKVKDAESRIPANSLEHILGKGLMVPFNNINAGARKIMSGTHRDHIFPLMNSESAIIETGYEDRFGDLSSSIIKSDNDYRLVAKISKFSFAPNHHYYLILEDMHNKRIECVERISYAPVTESYGYLYNNSYMDSLQLGSIIPKDTIVRKSLAYDNDNIRSDGINLNVAYMALDKNMEDSVILSDVAAGRMTSPLIKPVEIMINENDIPLNIYGTGEQYKCIPDIGEDIKDNILIALRKEKKEEALYSQSIERLKQVMMSDEKFTLNGKVIDIDIECNNPENLNNYYNSQFKMYYEELMRMSNEIVTTITPYQANGYDLSYDTKKLFATSKQIINGNQFIDQRLFSNLKLKIVVLEERHLIPGDKVSNRYGGKGVVSHIIPQKLMPQTQDGVYVDEILNSSTMYNRENPGQLFESSITFIGCQILNKIRTENVPLQDAIQMILTYMSFISPTLCNAYKEKFESQSEDEQEFLIDSMLVDDSIMTSVLPISETLDIDKLMAMYDAFPWITQVKVKVSMKDSSGNIRYVDARRRMIVGKQYTFRLKQYAEEKFSATNLSATNIRNENTKSKASKDFREAYSTTPIRFGNMETNDLNHLGAGYVITNLMIHSLSPHARRLTEQMFTDNPFNIDIKLDDESSNRSAEIVNTYLKTIGRRLVFRKIKKFKYQFRMNPLTFHDLRKASPILRPGVHFFDGKFYTPEEFYKNQEEDRKLYEKKKDKLVPALSFQAIDIDARAKYYNEMKQYEHNKHEEERKNKK